MCKKDQEDSKDEEGEGDAELLVEINFRPS
jgi:hypothetical protein